MNASKIFLDTLKSVSLYTQAKSMKRIALLIMVFIYTCSTTGISINEFYCCGKLKSVSFTFKDEKNGSCKKENVKSDCCKNKHQYFKVYDAHLYSTIAKQSSVSISITFTLPFTEYASPLKDHARILGVHSPPIDSSPPAYIQYCVFRV
jgi:hypothetical protein